MEVRKIFPHLSLKSAALRDDNAIKKCHNFLFLNVFGFSLAIRMLGLNFGTVFAFI